MSPFLLLSLFYSSVNSSEINRHDIVNFNLSGLKWLAQCQILLIRCQKVGKIKSLWPTCGNGSPKGRPFNSLAYSAQSNLVVLLMRSSNFPNKPPITSHLCGLRTSMLPCWLIRKLESGLTRFGLPHKACDYCDADAFA